MKTKWWVIEGNSFVFVITEGVWGDEERLLMVDKIPKELLKMLISEKKYRELMSHGNKFR